MKIYNYKIGKHTLHLLYNAEAMLEIQELGQSVSELTKEDNKASFQMLLKIVKILAEQGELYRRYMGYESEKIVSEEDLKRIVMPKDWGYLRLGVMQAVIEGMKQECQDEDEEIDIGLAELNKKKESKKQK